jgi:hypothetical protein
MPQKRVFVDTNAIFPAIKIGEWKRLCGHFSVETVDTIVGETQNGDVNRAGYVLVDKKMLESTLKKIHTPTHADRATFVLKAREQRLELDDGERDLLAYLMAHERPSPDILILTVSDRAAIRAACEFGWGDSMVSLSRLLEEAGAGAAALRSLDEQFTEPWLRQVRTNFLLGLVK